MQRLLRRVTVQSGKRAELMFRQDGRLSHRERPARCSSKSEGGIEALVSPKNDLGLAPAMVGRMLKSATR